MGINAHFRDVLGARLHHRRMSWGAVRVDDGTVFLRVWEDQRGEESEDESDYVWVTHDGPLPSDAGFGYRERREHVELLQSDSPGYAVFCRHKITENGGREIVWYDDEAVYPIIGIESEDGHVYAMLGRRTCVSDAAPSAVQH